MIKSLKNFVKKIREAQEQLPDRYFYVVYELAEVLKGSLVVKEKNGEMLGQDEEIIYKGLSDDTATQSLLSEYRLLAQNVRLTFIYEFKNKDDAIKFNTNI